MRDILAAMLGRRRGRGGADPRRARRDQSIRARATIEPPRLRTLIRLVWQAGTDRVDRRRRSLDRRAFDGLEPARHWVVATLVAVFGFAAFAKRLGDPRAAYWMDGDECGGGDGGGWVLGRAS